MLSLIRLEQILCVHSTFAHMFTCTLQLHNTPNQLPPSTLFSPARTCDFHFTPNRKFPGLQIHVLCDAIVHFHCAIPSMEVRLCMVQYLGTLFQICSQVGSLRHGCYRTTSSTSTPYYF